MAIVIPDQEVLEPWARSKKIPGDFAELCENEVGILHLKYMYIICGDRLVDLFYKAKGTFLYNYLFHQ